MFSTLMKISILLILSSIGNSAVAGQGFTCFEFNKLKKGEKEQYVKGYTLGAAMELLYLRSNYSKEEYPSEYVTEKYKLISIGVGYPKDFFEFTVNECNSPGASDAGMFDVLPVALTKMQKTGKFNVP